MKSLTRDYKDAWDLDHEYLSNHISSRLPSHLIPALLAACFPWIHWDASSWGLCTLFSTAAWKAPATPGPRFPYFSDLTLWKSFLKCHFVSKMVIVFKITMPIFFFPSNYDQVYILLNAIPYLKVNLMRTGIFMCFFSSTCHKIGTQ